MDTARLVDRLERGYEQIEAAKARGEDIEALETHWFRLLREYELAEDKRKAEEDGKTTTQG